MSRYDSKIVIIGGGIMGVSTAYFLAKRGQKDIILLERDLLAQASTGLCVGGIRQQFSHPANILLSQETIGLLRHFEREFHAKIDFHQAGYLFLTREQSTWEAFCECVKIQRRYGVPVEVLSPEEVKRRWPYLEIKGLKGGIFGPEDGYVDPYDVTMAIANKTRKLGIRILEKTEVTDIHLENNQVKGVATSRGPIFSRIIVNAAGAWGGEIAKMAGVELPIQPFRRQVFITKAFDAIPRPLPMIIDQDTQFYIRGYAPGILMGMTDLDELPSFHTHVDRSFMERVTAAALERVPVLEKAEMLRGWGGLYAMTPDENPIIGEIPGIKGFFCATGFSGHGFQHGPAVGRILSELILHGKTNFNLSPFSYDRFNKCQKTTELITV
ncbi:MAG: FAD-binding oxidoreductase [Candidatus Aminicenantes bacterium]|nr:MAG: FAD-binding oxidoreductase [Candidatus Aminicenantes bacterium]